MLKFNDYLKEAALSAKQKKIAAIAGDKDKIDAADLKALRDGKKPVDECDYGKMKKEELIGNQKKLDKNHNGKLDAQDFKMLRKEAKDGWSENDSLAKPVSSSQAMANHSQYFNKVTKLDPKTGYPYGEKPPKKSVKEEAEELDEGRMKELAMDLKDMSHDEFHKTYGHPKHHYDPTNFKKPVQPGHEMDRAKSLAQRGMQAAMHKEEVSQEMSPYVKGTLAVMDEGKIDDLRDAQKIRKADQSAYDKNFKPDESHPHITLNKGTAYGGSNQKDDEHDEKPDNETKEKKGRGRPAGSKSGARLKGGGHEDGGIPVHNLHLPKSYK
jgi:hypothetical protein